MSKLEKILSGIIVFLLLLLAYQCNKPPEKVIVNLKPVSNESDHNAPNNPWDNKF